MRHANAYTTFHEINFVNNLEPKTLKKYKKTMALRENWGSINVDELTQHVDRCIKKYNDAYV